MQSQIHEYLRSFAAELTAQSDRVRSLIADRHWLSDGTHKEYLLAAMLQRHLPSTVLLTKGFIADLNDASTCSNEQDILVLDVSSQGPLFSQGGLTIASPETVIATVSVKSTLSLKTLEQTIENQNSARRVVQAVAPTRPFFSAGYFFSTAKKNLAPSKVYKTYEEACTTYSIPNPIGTYVSTNPIGPDLLCCGGDFAYRSRLSRSDDGASAISVHGYQCNGLAAAILIAGIVGHVAWSLSRTASEVSSVLDRCSLSSLTPASHTFKPIYR